MNCPECAKLFDAYLDAQLSGTLQLEFDAHRVRCSRCQQHVALLESAGNVIATTDDAPPIAADFTASVMARIESRRRRSTLVRLAIGVGALQAAAAVLFGIWFYTRPAATQPTALATTAVGVVGPAELAEKPDAPAIKELIVERIEDRMWAMHSAGVSLTSDLVNLARYLNILLPDEVVRDSVKMADSSPWETLWNTLLPAPVEDTPEESTPANDVYSI